MNKPREEEKEMNSKEICSKKCDLINGIYIGQKNESWYCKTHKRTYWPNGIPRVYTQQELDQALQAERDRVLEKVEKFGEGIGCEKNPRWVLSEVKKIIGETNE